MFDLPIVEPTSHYFYSQRLKLHYVDWGNPDKLLMVLASSPYDFNMEDARRIWECITCPTLLIRGADSRASDPARAGWASAFHNRHAVSIAKAGLWVHHNQLDVCLQVVAAFVAGKAPGV
jgi:pimeloyl-ACP methyl ester carboxylesterase